jgi:hypothetical protein
MRLEKARARADVPDPQFTDEAYFVSSVQMAV